MAKNNNTVVLYLRTDSHRTLRRVEEAVTAVLGDRVLAVWAEFAEDDQKRPVTSQVLGDASPVDLRILARDAAIAAETALAG